MSINITKSLWAKLINQIPAHTIWAIHEHFRAGNEHFKISIPIVVIIRLSINSLVNFSGSHANGLVTHTKVHSVQLCQRSRPMYTVPFPSKSALVNLFAVDKIHPPLKQKLSCFHAPSAQVVEVIFKKETSARVPLCDVYILESNSLVYRGGFQTVQTVHNGPVFLIMGCVHFGNPCTHHQASRHRRHNAPGKKNRNDLSKSLTQRNDCGSTRGLCHPKMQQNIHRIRRIRRSDVAFHIRNVLIWHSENRKIHPDTDNI